MKGMGQFIARRIVFQIALAGAFIAAGGTFADSSQAGGSLGRAQILRDAKDPRWINGTISVSARPDQIKARIARLAEWPKFLSDIKSLKVIEHSGKRWHTKIETRTMDCGAHDYYIDVAADGSVTLVIDATGINANGRISAKPSAREGQSVARFSLFVETSGVIGWFIPESTLRARQERMVRRDLEDIAKAFASP